MKVFKWLSIFGLLIALVLFLRGRKKTGSISQQIQDSLTAQGYSPSMAKWWAAISAHETGGWTSRAFREGNNLFGMTLPSGQTTAVGLMATPNPEKLAQFKSVDDSIKDLVLFLAVRWKYPKNFDSLQSMLDYMKARIYFTDSMANYSRGVNYWLNKI